MGLRAHDVAVLRRVLRAAVYGEQRVPARRDRRHRWDMRNRGFDQAERARLQSTARCHAIPRLDRAEYASVILHAPRRAQRRSVERDLRLVRCSRDGSLANYVGGSCRMLGHVDGGVVCAARAGAEVVLCGGEEVTPRVMRIQVNASYARCQYTSNYPGVSFD